MQQCETKSCEILDLLMRNGLCSAEFLKDFIAVKYQLFLQGIGNFSRVPRSFSKEAAPVKEQVNKITVNLTNVLSSLFVVLNIFQLLQLLVEFLGLPEGREYEEERTLGTLKMMVRCIYVFA